MKLIRSFGFACNGLRICFTSEANFKIHVFITLVTISLGIGLNISASEWMAVLICFAIVLLTELFNTAIEELCDVVQQNFHPGIKRIKDIAAGAVLVAAVASFIIGIIIFFPKIINFIKSV